MEECAYQFLPLFATVTFATGREKNSELHATFGSSRFKYDSHLTRRVDLADAIQDHGEDFPRVMLNPSFQLKRESIKHGK